MEPSFIATPYMQASTPSSLAIRAMLDQQEARYLEWRRERKSVRHPFASQKLNSACRLAPVAAGRSLETQTAPISPVQAVRDKYSLGPSRSAESLLHAGGKRKDAIQLGVGLATAVRASRHELPRLSQAVGAPQATDRERGQELRDGGRCRKRSEGTTSRRPAVANAPALGVEEEASRLVRAPRAAYKLLKPYLHDYYTRQVFSFESSSPDDDAHGEDSPYAVDTETQASEERREEDGAKSASMPSGSAAPDALGSLPSPPASELIVPGLELVAQHEYDAIFEVDWRGSGVDKTVRDAVDRKRIAGVLRSGYRVLLWFFRLYAGNAAVHAAATAGPASGHAAAALGPKLFEIPSALKLLEDLNVPCVDPAAFGIADAPLRRESLVDLVLGVARMSCAHAADPARQRVLVGDGVELSESVRALVHDHFAAFSQIQDVNHFRAVFLGKRGRGASSAFGSDGRSLEQVLDAHAVSLASLFEELSRLGGASSGSSSSAKASRGSVGGVSCAEFVSLLYGLRLIAAKGIVGPGSCSTGQASAAAGSAADAPAGIEELRAVRIFLSCLPVAAPAQELQLPQLTEALLRTALAWRERAVCRGRYDVCPAQLSSDACACRPDSADYALDEFRDAVQEVLARVQLRRRARAQKRATVKMASVRSVRATTRRPSMRASVASMASGISAGFKDE